MTRGHVTRRSVFERLPPLDFAVMGAFLLSLMAMDWELNAGAATPSIDLLGRRLTWPQAAITVTGAAVGVLCTFRVVQHLVRLNKRS